MKIEHVRDYNQRVKEEKNSLRLNPWDLFCTNLGQERKTGYVLSIGNGSHYWFKTKKEAYIKMLTRR